MACEIKYGKHWYPREMFNNIYGRVVKDGNSYYRTQLESPEIDIDGNLFTDKTKFSRDITTSFDIDQATKSYWAVQVQKDSLKSNKVPYGSYNIQKITPHQDEITYQKSSQQLLQRMGQRYNMNQQGFMPGAINPNELKKDLKARGLGHVAVAKSRVDTYYFKLKGKFYNPFNPTYLYQLKSSDIPVDEQLEQAVQVFLDKIGAKVNLVEEIEHDAVARVEVLSKVIDIVEGNRGLDTLTEEAAHIMVAMMRGSRSYNNMMQSIANFPEYTETLKEYDDVQGYDNNKIREEAVVKLITSLAIDEHLSKEQHRLSRTWWQVILDYLKDLFKKDAVSEYKKAARSLLKGDISNLTHIPKEEVFYQIEADETAMKKRLDQVNNMIELDIKIKGDRYYIPGEKKTVRFRVSDKVHELSKDIYTVKENTPELRSFYTTKGTIIHAYNQLIMEAFNNKEKEVNNTTIRNKVYQNLRKHPEFERYQSKEYYSLSNDQFKGLVDGVRQLRKDILSRDKKAKIFTEFKVYNPKNSIDDIGGTIDVFVVYSDGTIGMYDYKSMRYWWNTSNKEFYKVEDTKRQLFDIQLSQYKLLLKEAWGLTSTDFRETRIVPLNMQFTMRGDLTEQRFKKLEMHHPKLKGDDKNYLKQMSVAGEYVPSDKNLNNFLGEVYTKRTELRNELSVSKGDTAQRLRLRIQSLNNMIDTIIVDQDINIALNDIGNVIKHVKTEGSTFTPKMILHYLDLLKVYQNFNIAFEESLEDLTPDQKTKVESKIREYNHSIDATVSTLHQMIADTVAEFSDMDLSKGGKIKGFLGQMFDGIVDWNNPVIFTMGTLFAEQREKTLRKLLSHEKDIYGKHDAYVKWAKSKGYSGVNLFKPLIRDYDRNLITRFKSEFYEDGNNMKTEGRRKHYAKESIEKEREWFEKHYTFDEVKWNKGLENLKEMLNENAAYTKKDKAAAIKKFEGLNPKKHSTAWFARRNFYIKPKEALSTDQSDYISDDWKFIHQKGNEAARDYLDMYYKLNDMMRSMVGYDKMSRNFVANIHANTIEKAGDLGIFKEFTVLADWRRLMEVRDNDYIYGVPGKDGKPMSAIPLLYHDTLKGHVSDKDKVRIREEVAKIYESGSIEYLNEVESREYKLMYEKGVRDKSRDLTKSLILMLKSAYDYSHKAEIEDNVLLLREFLTLKDFYKEIPTDQFNRPILDKVMGVLQEKAGAAASTLEVADKFINLHMYGQRIQGKQATITIGNRTYATAKLVQAAQNFLSIKALGLNPILAGASNMGAQINKRIVGKKGVYYNNSSWKEALNSYTSADEKALSAIWFFEPSSRNINYDKALKKSASGAVKFFNVRNIFALHRGVLNKKGSKKYGIDNPVFGDDNIDNTIMVAMMKHWVIDSDGKIRSKGDPFKKIKDPNAKTIWEAFKVEGDKMEVEGLSDKEFTRFRRLVHKAQTAVKGSLTEDQNHIANTQIAGMMLLKFRNWMPGLIREKFGKFRYDNLLETYQQGHFRTFAQEILPYKKSKAANLGLLDAEQEMLASNVGGFWGHILQPSLRAFSNLFKELVGFGVWKYKLDMDKANFYYLKYKNDLEITDPDFTLEAFIEFRQKQFKAMALEIRYLLGVAGLITGIMAAAGWDDNKDNVLTYNLYRLAKRSGLELSFFFSWDSVTEITGSPFPLMRLVSDFYNMGENFAIETSELVGIKDPNNRDRTPYGYYTLKNIPGVNQVLTMGAYFNTGQDKTLFQKIFGESDFFEGYILSR